MLNGKKFGEAIKNAIALKIKTGSVKSKAAIARHFGVKPSSVEDWIKKGAISKQRLPELYRYFSDVANWDHWGLREEEWPIGLTQNRDANPESISKNQAIAQTHQWPFSNISPEEYFSLEDDQRKNIENRVQIFLDDNSIKSQGSAKQATN